MKLSNESKTLFIPLYGKAIMSKNKLFIKDKKAEEIVDNIQYDFSKLTQPKYLSMYMALRARILDEFTDEILKNNCRVTVIHLGCGLDSRVLRVKEKYKMWFDLDFSSVIDIRKKYYNENKNYKMIGKSVTDLSWINEIEEKNNILILAEGLLMYLTEDEIINILDAIYNNFSNVTLLFDSYTKKAVKYSKYKNPVNQMKATILWGIDNEQEFLKLNKNLEFIKSYNINHKEDNLKGITKFIFENIYCGKISKKLYKIYKFKLKRKEV